ncbi:MAG: creatininase [Phycisphaerales bacterium]|nr:creatininase [Phycisphaerales bacterium]
MNQWLPRVATLAGGPAVLWDELTWPEMATLVASNTDTALLPLGATEQHGPQLPLNTDSVFAHAFCCYASAKTGVPVLPPVTYGCSLGHTGQWPGTVSVFPETLIAMLRQVAQFVQAAGFRRLMLINSHWGNVPAARCAIDHVRFDAFEKKTGFSIGLRSTFDLTASIWQQFTDDAADFHANRAETALMLAIDPAAVRMDKIKEADDPDRTAGRVFTHVVPLTSTNGVTGYPSRATAEDGQKLFIEIGDALTAVVRQAQIEVPPLTEGNV